MRESEKKIVDKLSANLPYIGGLIALIAGIYARWTCAAFISYDMDVCLLSWYSQMESFSGWREALITPVGNYNLLYQFIMYIFTFLPGGPVKKIKALSCLFDLLLALLVGKKVKDYTNDSNKGIVGAIIVFALPTVLLNSSLWGQCDSIYTFFAIWAIFELIDKKYSRAFILWGVAFAFKLQAIFIAPIFIVTYLKRKDHSILNYLYIPATMWVTGLPAIIAGRGFTSPLRAYMDQVGSSECLIYYYPNIWMFFTNIMKGTLPVEAMNESFHFAPTFIALCSMIVFAVWIIKKDKWEENRESMLLLAIIGTMVLLYFLPSMHERYGYIIEIMMVAYALIDKRGIIPAILVQISGLITYRVHLLELDVPDWLPVLNLVGLILVVSYINKLFGEKDK